jgi:hypothetical protein
MKKSFVAMAAVLSVSATFFAGIPSAQAAGSCRTIFGPFTSIAPAECASPVGICTLGTLKGTFPSTYNFVAQTLAPSRIKNVYTYTGNSTVSTATETLLGNDEGIMLMRADGTANFTTFVRLAHGLIIATGKMSMITGAAQGSYFGQVCE